MKAAFALIAAAGLVAAQDFGGVPSCALPCLADAIPKVGCSLTDTACQCDPAKQTALAPIVAGCLVTACSPADLAKAQQAAAAACAAFSATAKPSGASSTSAAAPSTTSRASTTAAGTGSSTTARPTTTSTRPSNGTTSTTTTGPRPTAGANAGPLAYAGGAILAFLGAIALV